LYVSKKTMGPPLTDSQGRSGRVLEHYRYFPNDCLTNLSFKVLCYHNQLSDE